MVTTGTGHGINTDPVVRMANAFAVMEMRIIEALFDQVAQYVAKVAEMKSKAPANPSTVAFISLRIESPARNLERG